MIKMSLKRIAEKLGFDPLHPPKRDLDPFLIDDATPSIWAPLTEDELAYVHKKATGRDLPGYDYSQIEEEDP